MKTTKNITIIKEAEAITATVPVLEIRDSRSLALATSTLSIINGHLDKVTAEKERVTKPLNEALKAERSRWRPIEDQLNNAIADIRLKMSDYQTNLINAQKAEQDRLAELVASGALSLKTGLKRIEALDTPEDKILTGEGSLSFRPIKTLEIFAPDLVPDSYWTIDEALLLEDLKSGKEIAGAKIKIIQSPINRRN